MLRVRQITTGIMLLLLFSSSLTNTAQNDTIRIGGIHPLTGGLAGDGVNMDNAIRMAVDEINAAGGVLDGRLLEYLSADSAGAPNTGQREAERLIGQGAVALVCCFQSAVTAEVARVAEREGVPLLIDVTAADTVIQRSSRFTFRLQPNATVMGSTGADYLVALTESVGETVETVVYLHEGTTDFGREVSAAFVQRAQVIGLEVLDIIAYDLNSADLTTEMTLINALSPDVLVVTGYYNDGLLIARNAEEVGLDVKAVYGVGQGTFDQPQFVRDEAALAECFINTNFYWDVTSREAQAVRERYEARFREPMRASAVLAYQAVYLIADAITRAESDDPALIRDALADTDYDDHLLAYDGPITFDANGEAENALPVVLQVQNRRVVQVWPEANAQARPLYPCTSWGY